MLHDVARVVSAVLLGASALGLAYLAGAIAATMAFARRTTGEPPVPLPSVTVLKPVAGLQPELEEDLASFCRQRYDDFEVIFCLHDANDPALPAIAAARAAAPECATRVLAGDDRACANPKIANLTKATGAIRGDLVVIADSDVRVDPDYLRAVAFAFGAPGIEAVTCLYRALAPETFVGRLGAAYIEEQFAPSVLVATAIGPLRFCLGAAMAVRASALSAIGGLPALGAFLADDHKLGELVSARGGRVALSRYVVATHVSETSLGELWSHELRWARTSRTLAPAGYFFSFLMFPLPLALLFLAVSGNLVVGGALIAAAIVLRALLHYAARAALGVRSTPAPWIGPIRDVVSFALWAVSLSGRSVRWRNDDLTIGKNGEL